ncbi:beta-1,3-galactosyltransferase 5-like isoform X2 [Sitodiplosis mosellana]|uniref:beta-1,3-galactosyltransferase 5-like isoform X2 n=1 Tax=Sitodiplosis mosellana TaxID=263140 RepID=UPI00244501A9|nr:beta-1,3-galactosyltransferase 5-like isoform X2 [Sitodiplosis mosellana]
MSKKIFIFQLRLRSLVRILLIAVTSLNILIILLQFSTYSLPKKSKLFHILEDVNENPNRMFDVPEFKYLISKPRCSRNSLAPYFVTLVHSSPTQFERRAACRNTWAHSDPRTETYFLMGMVQSSSLQKRINDEDAQFNDIIQGNFIDSYHNLTYKHTMALKWFTDNCPDVKYLLKLDDDVFVNIPAMHKFLATNKNDQKFILGIYFPPQETCRQGKWKISYEDIIENFVPEYASGQSVIYSNDFVREAYKKTFTTKFLWIDDLYITGYIRMQLNIRVEPIYPFRLSDDALQMVLNGSTTKLPDPMFIVSEHDRKYDEMIKLWKFTEEYRSEHFI